MTTPSYSKIIQKGAISNEFELEQALIIERKLRLMAKQNPEIAESRNQLRSIIKAYEDLIWNKNALISDEKIKESDRAENSAEQEREFLAKRKKLIQSKLKEHELNQQDLGTLLGHSKSYISELINGINPFTLKDLIIIHKLFNIKLENLIPTTIPEKESKRIQLSLVKINKPNLRMKKDELLLL
jgi:transcriptional regulator with XRE-family HTH domain